MSDSTLYKVQYETPDEPSNNATWEWDETTLIDKFPFLKTWILCDGLDSMEIITHAPQRIKVTRIY